MNSKLSMITIYGVFVISVIFIMAQSNTNGEVFAQAGVAGNNHIATSKANNGNKRYIVTYSIKCILEF